MAAFFVSIAAIAALPLGCGAAQEEYTEVRHAPEPSVEPQPEHILAAATEETIEAVKRKRKVDSVCEPAFAMCMSYPFQPDWNIELFGKYKNCKDCRWECQHANGVWPAYKCPPPGYLPN